MPQTKSRTSSTSTDNGVFDVYMEELTCLSCRELYNDAENPPLTTFCGHTFCSPCIRDQLLKSRKLRTYAKCFTCQANLDILCASDLPVNRSIVKLANCMSFKMLHPELPKDEEEEKEIITVMPTVKPSSGESVGECKHHMSPLTSRCTKCNIWMCAVCMRNHLKASTGKEKCEIVPASKEMRVIKESQNTLTRLHIDKLSILKGDLLSRIAFLNTRKRENQVVTTTLKEELLQIEVNIRGIEHKQIVAEEKISEVQSWIETLLESRSRTFLADTVEEIETSQEETTRYLNEVTTWIRSEQDLHHDWKEDDVNFIIPRASGPVGLEYLKQRVILSQELYTIDYRDGVPRWATINICDKYLILHAHTSTKPPKGATLVHYKELTDAMPKLPGAFLDIAWDDTYQGRVFFEFFSVNPRSLQYLLLCMGDWGPCYKGTKLMPHGISYLMSITDPTFTNRSILYGGNYNQGSNEGCPAVYDSIKDGGEHTKLKVPGLLAGIPNKDNEYLAMFKIYLEVTDDGSFCNTAFGNVERGLPILQAAAHKLSETTVTIQDCGLVFPIW